MVTCRQINWAPIATPMVTRKTVDARRPPTRSGSTVVAARHFSRVLPTGRAEGSLGSEEVILGFAATGEA